MTINDILIWMLCGLIVGIVARVFLPGPQNIGLIMTMLLGIVGAILGGIGYTYIGERFNDPLAFAGPWQWWIAAIAGGMIVIGIYSAFSSRRTYRYDY
jgi:uncharacterized membrane protein YeaQ/YmgE (transglycosylase-associated protein family)